MIDTIYDMVPADGGMVPMARTSNVGLSSWNYYIDWDPTYRKGKKSASSFKKHSSKSKKRLEKNQRKRRKMKNSNYRK